MTSNLLGKDRKTGESRYLVSFTVQMFIQQRNNMSAMEYIEFLIQSYERCGDPVHRNELLLLRELIQREEQARKNLTETV